MFEDIRTNWVLLKWMNSLRLFTVIIFSAGISKKLVASRVTWVVGFSTSHLGCNPKWGILIFQVLYVQVWLAVGQQGPDKSVISGIGGDVESGLAVLVGGIDV